MNETRPNRTGDSRTHFLFAMLLVLFVWIKFDRYIGPSRTREFNAGAIGASISQFAVWIVAYLLCLGSRRTPLMTAIAWLAFLVSVVSLPVVGWMGLGLMVALRLEERRARKAVDFQPQKWDKS